MLLNQIFNRAHKSVMRVYIYTQFVSYQTHIPAEFTFSGFSTSVESRHPKCMMMLFYKFACSWFVLQYGAVSLAGAVVNPAGRRDFIIIFIFNE